MRQSSSDAVLYPQTRASPPASVSVRIAPQWATSGSPKPSLHRRFAQCSLATLDCRKRGLQNRLAGNTNSTQRKSTKRTRKNQRKKLQALAEAVRRLGAVVPDAAEAAQAAAGAALGKAAGLAAASGAAGGGLLILFLVGFLHAKGLELAE